MDTDMTYAPPPCRPRPCPLPSLRTPLPHLQSFTGFTMIFFVIEVAMLLAAFRGKFFRHLGYVLDLAVISICVYHDLAGMSKGDAKQ